MRGYISSCVFFSWGKLYMRSKAHQTVSVLPLWSSALPETSFQGTQEVIYWAHVLLDYLENVRRGGPQSYE